MKKLIAMLMAVIMVVGLSACGSSTNTPASTTAAATTAAAETTAATEGASAPITINVIASSGGSGKSLAAAIESFNKAYAGKIEVVGEYIAQESMLERMLLQFVSGTASTDVISTLWQAQTNQYFEPLDEYMKKDGIDPKQLYGDYLVETCSVDGVMTTVPVRTNTVATFYRKDLFEEAGLSVPTTLDEYLDCARKLTVKDGSGNVTRYGTSLKMQSPAYTCQQFAYFLMPLGGYFLTEDNEHASPTLKSQTTYDILKVMKTIQDENLCPDPLSFTYDDNVVAMQTDKVAFSIELNSRASLMDKEDASEVIGLVDFAYFPVNQIESQPCSTYTSTWSLGIDKNCKNKEAAWEFVKWAGNYEQQEMMAYDYSNGPTILSIYDEPGYQEKNRSALATKKVFENAVLRPCFPVEEASELENIVHEELQKFMLGEQDEVATGDNMFNRIEKVMTE